MSQSPAPSKGTGCSLPLGLVEIEHIATSRDETGEEIHQALAMEDDLGMYLTSRRPSGRAIAWEVSLFELHTSLQVLRITFFTSLRIKNPTPGIPQLGINDWLRTGFVLVANSFVSQKTHGVFLCVAYQLSQLLNGTMNCFSLPQLLQATRGLRAGRSRVACHGKPSGSDLGNGMKCGCPDQSTPHRAESVCPNVMSHW